MIDQISLAVEKLKNGEIVAIPTETVYGLAALISNEDAIRKIFLTKERPFFDPLIVHVANCDQAKTLTTNWSDAVDRLAREFWPGPLTLVLPKKNVNDLITSGLQTVGIRCPDHPMARSIIEKLGEPLAAPSANKFGKTSPSCAEHTAKEFGPELFVVDGGACKVGIESTIITVIEDDRFIEVSILRKGMITATQIQIVLAKQNFKEVVFKKPTENIVAPGQVEHHYMPTIPILWVSRKMLKSTDLLGLSRVLLPGQGIDSVCELYFDKDPAVAARELYSRMRDCGNTGSDLIICIREDYQTGERWDGILDRLLRASTFRFLME
jgi:L-threonylcarbamoyladenylate synthase